MRKPAGLLLTESIDLVCARDRRTRFGTVRSNNLHNGNTKQQGESIPSSYSKSMSDSIFKIVIVLHSLESRNVVLPVCHN